jgi:N-acetylglutamate synthase-like GNAT family acetyltransferase
MIRSCTDNDFDQIWTIINDGAIAYKGIIPADRWHEPYMSQDELRSEIAKGVEFSCFEQDGVLLGVMGIQHVQDVTLIRHAYTRTTSQKQGIGARLLTHLREQTSQPILIGTWADAVWAIGFYERQGFCMVPSEQKSLLLKKYWTVPDRQIDTSVVLADPVWYQQT